MNKIIDSHAHLEDIAAIKEALSRAKEAGVIAVITAGVNHESNKKVLEISREYGSSKDLSTVFPSLGIHPGDVIGLELNSAFKFIEENIKNAVAVGEIGLDFWYKEARKNEEVQKLQEKVYLKLLDCAKRENKPAVIHSRGAWKECFQKAAESGIKKAVFHWYSGPEDVLEGILKAGYFISATPSLEYSPEHQKAVKKAPLERLLLETDSPVVFKPESGKYRSEPKDAVRTLKAVAKIKNVTEAEVAEKTTDNTIKLFGLAGL